MNAAAKKTTYDSLIETVDDTGTTTINVEWWIFDGMDEANLATVVVSWEWVDATDSGWSYHYSVVGDLPTEVSQALGRYVERLALERGAPR